MAFYRENLLQNGILNFGFRSIQLSRIVLEIYAGEKDAFRNGV